MDTLALNASTRFGLGPEPTEMETMGNDPKAWLEMQLRQAFIPPELLYLQDNSPIEALYRTFYEERREQRLQAAEKTDPSPPATSNSATDTNSSSKQDSVATGPTNTMQAATHNSTLSPSPMQPPRTKPLFSLGKAFFRQCEQRMTAQINSSQPFIERLVLFWSNHFTVSIKKPLLMGLVNPYEVQAIRTSLMGHFADLLIAVVQHPAMLIYLDNANSIGPNSKLGLRKSKSINENLGREILELHTLGVDGGYTQNDVIALAKIITGWSLARENGNMVMKFQFLANRHEPGSKVLLGKSYAEGGIEEGLQALKDLAHHPATAKHVSTKLARHFISDNPHDHVIAKLTKIYMNTDGHLPAMYHALINMTQAWETPLTKFKNSYEYVVSALRLSKFSPNQQQMRRILRANNAIPFSAPSPAGLPDMASFWASPDTMLKRIEWSRELSQKMSDQFNALETAQKIFGELLHEQTRFIIAGAPSPQNAFAFLLASPEFQRR